MITRSFVQLTDPQINNKNVNLNIENRYKYFKGMTECTPDELVEYLNDKTLDIQLFFYPMANAILFNSCPAGFTKPAWWYITFDPSIETLKHIWEKDKNVREFITSNCCRNQMYNEDRVWVSSIVLGSNE